mmetsp:Transcript_18882/g.34185  ORF Transcript_18882/g.34185 Transcript_18882/m.34185 type:complete len:83 (-) Transcript_18882:1476-1724(-)
MEDSLDWVPSIQPEKEIQLDVSFIHSEPSDSFVKEIEAMQICEADTMPTATIKAHIEAFQLTMETEEDAKCKLACGQSCLLQ